MLKRKATSQLTRDGQEIPNEEQEEEQKLDTPEAIQNRKIFRARRPLRQPVFEEKEQAKFQLDKSLIDKDKEEELLATKHKPKVSFMEVKPSTPFKSSVLQSLITKLNTQKEEDITDSFIKSAKNKEEVKETSPISLTPIAKTPQLNTVCKVPAQLSVDKVPRGEGHLEVVKGKINEKPIAMLLFRNSIQNIVFQAAILSNCALKQVEALELTQDEDSETLEFEVNLYRKSEKPILETCRFAITKDSESVVKKAFEEVKSFTSS